MRFTLASLLVASTSVIASQNAGAADLPAKPVYKAPAAIVAANWTGPYLGAFVGPTATRSRAIHPTGVLLGGLENTGVGVTAGGTVGYNWELGATPFGGRWLVGLEGDFGYFSNSHSVQDFNDFLIYEPRTKWLATGRGRVGITNGPNLSYFTGGYAALRLTDSTRKSSAVSRARAARSKAAGPSAPASRPCSAADGPRNRKPFTSMPAAGTRCCGPAISIRCTTSIGITPSVSA